MVLKIRRAYNAFRNIVMFRMRFPYVRYGNNVICKWSTSFWTQNPYFVLGYNVCIGYRCLFQCHTEIGNNVLIASDVAFVNSDDHRFDVVGKVMWDSGRGDGYNIVVEDDVWIGHGSIIMSPSHIGRGAIVGAGSVVKSNVPPYAIIAGVPTKVIRMRFTPEEIVEHERILAKEKKLQKKTMGMNRVSKEHTRPVPRLRVFGELPLLMVERVLRQLYWDWAGLRRWRRKRDGARKAVLQKCDREDLFAYLKSVGVSDGALVLLHTRITGVQITSRDIPEEAGNLKTARALLDDILDLVGEDGTLAMPTAVKYQTDALYDERPGSEITTYDPARSVCSAGLVNELFRRMKGTKRSLYPYNMVAAFGPLAEELLQENLNERKPSPHGVDSSYFRICRHNGLVLSIGVPLRKCITLAHVVEEVREDWPIKDFFSPRQYRVVQNGKVKEWTVRMPRDQYVKFCHCQKKMGRDLVAEGVIHEGCVGTVRVDWARAGEVYDFFLRKTEKRPYPYYGLWMMRKPWKNKN